MRRVAADKCSATVRAHENADLSWGVPRKWDQANGTVVNEIARRRKRTEGRSCETSEPGSDLRRPVLGDVSANSTAQAARTLPFRFGDDDIGGRKICEASDVICMQMRKHHPTYLLGLYAEPAELRTDLVLRLELEASNA